MMKKKVQLSLRFFCLVILLLNTRLKAQIIIEEEPNRLYYEFAIKRVTNFWDMKNFRDVFHVNKYWLGKNRITGNVAYNTGRVLVSDGNGYRREEFRQAISFGTRLRFFEQFSFNTNFYIDFN